MSNNKITQEQINKLISNSTIDETKIGKKSTVVALTLPNGFTIIESSSCVDPDNYDHEMGRKICLKRIEEKVWELEGYRLQCELSNN